MNEFEKLEIFHKEEGAELDDSERILALRCASEFLDEPLHAFTPDYLRDSLGCLTTSRARGTLLCFFFKTASSFLENFWRILDDYAKCLSHRRDTLKRHRYGNNSEEDVINVIVFTPSYEATWTDFLTQVRFPMQFVPYIIVSSRGRKAIVLDAKSAVSPERGIFTDKQRFDVTEVPGKKVSLTDIESQADDSEVWETGTGLPEQRTSSDSSHESFFQRAKLTSEEIRALLDFELRLEEIKAGV